MSVFRKYLKELFSGPLFSHSFFIMGKLIKRKWVNHCGVGGSDLFHPGADGGGKGAGTPPWKLKCCAKVADFRRFGVIFIDFSHLSPSGNNGRPRFHPLYFHKKK